jgi:DNA-binding CsgD family transcriptional regulator
MQPRDRLNAKEVQVATLVWQGLTNKDIAGVLGASEQVIKNYLRTTFDKLGVWTRLELALYVAAHGGVEWYRTLGISITLPSQTWNGQSAEETAVPVREPSKATAVGLS